MGVYGGIMAKWEIGGGIKNYINELERIERLTPDMIGSAIYEGARIVTDACRKEIERLPKSDVTAVEREGLLNGLGIASMQRTLTSSNVKVGEDGYNNAPATGKYIHGKANAMIARAIISGTSFHPRKNDFMMRAAKSVHSQAEKAMKDEFDNQLKKYV